MRYAGGGRHVSGGATGIRGKLDGKKNGSDYHVRDAETSYLGARGRVSCYMQGRKIPEGAYMMVEILQETWRRRDKKIE